jgi:hypothetical protein
MATSKRTRAQEKPDRERDAVDEIAAIEDAVAEAEELEELREIEAALPGLIGSLKSKVEGQLQALGSAYYRFAGLEMVAGNLEARLDEQQAIIREREELLHKVREAEAEAPFLRDRLERIREAIALEQAAIAGAARHLADTIVERTGLQTQLATVHNETAAITKEIADANTNLTSLQARLSEVSQKVQQEQQTLDQWQEKLRVTSSEELTLGIKLLIARHGEGLREHLLAALGANPAIPPAAVAPAAPPAAAAPAAPAAPAAAPAAPAVAAAPAAAAPQPPAQPPLTAADRHARPHRMYAFSGQVNTERGQPAPLAGYTVIDPVTRAVLKRGKSFEGGEITFTLDQQSALLILDRDPDDALIVTGNPVPEAPKTAFANA